jgi:metallo-beta-lactamase class B
VDADRILDARPGDVRLAPDVLVRAIAPGVWLHVTMHQYPGGPVYPSNGLLVDEPGGSTLIDTAWDDRQTELLLTWTSERGHPVRRAVGTHFHDDRLGGIRALRARSIPVKTHPHTARLAVDHGQPAPDSIPGFVDSAAVAGLQLFYPGPGHTRDNVVVYLPGEHILVGGCLVKADTTTTLGNVADADLSQWAETADRVRRRYPSARLVIPGHGRVGGEEALTSTAALVRRLGPAALLNKGK